MKDKFCDLPIVYGNAVLHLFLSRRKEAVDYQVCPVHKHAYYELHIVRRGERLYRIDHREILLREQELLIIPPGTEHEPLDPHDPAYHVTTLAFALERREDILPFYSLFQEALQANALVPVNTNEDLLTQLSWLEALPLPTAAGAYCRFQVAGTAFVCELFHALHAFDTQKLPAADSFLMPDGLPAMIDMLVHQRDLPLRAIAKELNYSERHTARLIKNIYHMTLSELRAQSSSVSPKQEEAT